MEKAAKETEEKRKKVKPKDSEGFLASPEYKFFEKIKGYKPETRYLPKQPVPSSQWLRNIPPSPLGMGSAY